MCTITTRSIPRVMGGIVCALVLSVALASGQTNIGIITDGAVRDAGPHPVIVFNADTDTIIGTVVLNLTSEGFLHDAVIVPGAFQAFVTSSSVVPLSGGAMWVIDLSPVVAALAGGINPIVMANPGTDIAVTPDHRFIVASDGTTGFPPIVDAPPMSVVEVATRLEVSTFATISDNSAVDVCENNSVLMASNNGLVVRRLSVNSAGTLSDTGESSPIKALNVACAPGSTFGVAVGAPDPGPTPGLITSFAMPGLTTVDARALSASFGQTALMTPAGDRVYVRSAGGAVDVFTYDPAAGTLGAAPLLTIPIAPFVDFDGDIIQAFGQDLIALHPNGNKLYVSEPNAVRVFDAHTGALLTSITDPNIREPLGLAVATLPNRPPLCTAAAATPSTVQTPVNHELVAVSISGVTDPDGEPVTLAVTSVFQDEPVSAPGGGAGATAPDATLVPLAVRQERDGTGDGRVYHIGFTGADGKGGTCSGTVKVCVARDGQSGAACGDGGPLFNSLVQGG